jgi:hypothetical protein
MDIAAWTDQAFRRFAASKLPFSLFLRWVIVSGIAVRGLAFYLQSPGSPLASWLVALAGYLAYTITITFVLLRRPAFQKQRAAFLVQFTLDTAFCAIFYFLGDTVNSDLYLNFILPLIIILEFYRDAFHILACSFIVWAVLLATMMLLTRYCETDCTYAHVFLRSYLPRVILGTCVMGFAARIRYPSISE